MRKVYLAIVVAAVIGIAYTFVTSSQSQTGQNLGIVISLEKTTVNYGDILDWKVEGLSPNTDYVATIRLPDIVFIVNSGTSDDNGEASGSFLIGDNLPAGTFAFRVESASDKPQFNEVSVRIVPSTISLSVTKTTVDYGDTVNWSAKRLPRNTDYVATIRLPDIIFIVDSGTSDDNGEASGSFLIGDNLPAGTFAFRVESASDPAQFGEVSIRLLG